MRRDRTLRETRHPYPLVTGLLTALIGLTLAPLGAATSAYSAPATLPSAVDVLVVGSEPEGIVAAVAAAEEGARTLLVTEAGRLGGLFVTGEMNSLDLRTTPTLLQRGLFERWWNRVGRASAFDVAEAEAAFEAMLEEAGVTVVRGAPPVRPLTENGQVTGVRVGEQTVTAYQVVDATSEGDLAAAAGAAYTLGFSSLGLEARMADTLVFRMEGVDWEVLKRSIRARGPGYAEIDARAAWGHFGGFPAAYEAQEEGVRLRGLNLGRQADGSVLVNALLIYDIDPFDPVSRAAGRARAEREAPRIVAYLRALPGLEGATYGGVAETLYVRETRHFSTRCTLSVDDVLGNVVSAHDVAAGSYPLDVQTLTPADDGFVYGVPEVYGAQLCVTLPEGVDNLWVAGKTAGYDPLAASSARVVPFGMALGEAIGVAAAQAARGGLRAHAYADDEALIQSVRARLRERGAYLPEVRARAPSGPADHPHFGAYQTLRRRALALGGYDNDPKLDAEMPARGFLYLLANVGARFWGDAALGKALVEHFPDLPEPLTPEVAGALVEAAGCALGRCEGWAQVVTDLAPGEVLTRGEAYALAAHLAELGARD
jgi:hypothetical protein